MPKFMNETYRLPMNLQLFAEDTTGGENDTAEDVDAGDGDDQTGDDAGENGEDEPRYTEADLKKAISRTIAKERRRAEKAAKAKTTENSDKDNAETDDNKTGADADKLMRLEVKIACFEAGVTKDAVDDVAILAKAYMDADEELDLEDAIEKVIKKHPQFLGNASKAEESDETGTEKKKKVFVRGTSGTHKPNTVSPDKAFLDQRYANNPYYKK